MIHSLSAMIHNITAMIHIIFFLTLFVSFDRYRALFFERYDKAIWASDKSQRNLAYLPPSLGT